jgi:hypothetical protein
MQRVLEKFGHWAKTAEPARDRGDQAHLHAVPQVISPRMWPSFASSASRKFNKRLLKSALTHAADHGRSCWRDSSKTLGLLLRG